MPCRNVWPITLLLLLSLSIGACSPPRPINVAVLFESSWTLRGDPLLESDREAVKQATLETLRHAFDGFAVRFSEGTTGNRTGPARLNE